MTAGKVIDLDAIVGETVEHEIRVAGRVFKAPGDLNVEQLIAMRDLSGEMVDLQDKPEEGVDLVKRFLAGIFGEEQAAELFSLCGLKHLGALIEGIVDLYELDSGGKVLGSSRASRRAGARSKPTSGATTTRASTPRASATKKSGSQARSSRG